MIDENLSNLIGMIYEAAVRPDLWPAVLEGIADVSRSAVATLYSHDMTARTPTFHASFGTTPAAIEDYQLRWAATNPIIDGMLRLEPGQVAPFADILDYDAFTRSAFFIEWGLPQGYVDGINIMLERTPARLSFVAMIRKVQVGAADRSRLVQLQLLAPHILRSVRLGRALEHATVERDAFRATLDTLAASVILLDDDGTVLHTNTSAATLAEKGLTVEKIKAASVKTPAPAKASASAGAPADETFTVEADGGERYVCHSLPVHFATNGSGSTHANMLVLQSGAPTQHAARAVAATFCLTRREGDVFFGIVELGGVNAVSDGLGLSKETVRKHLQSVFVKTNTHSQADLVKLAVEFATPFRIGSS